MAEFKAILSPAKSSKKFIFNYDPKDDLPTIITQFKLDLPSKYQLTNLQVRQINNIDCKYKPRLTALELIKILQEINKDQLLMHLCQDKYDCLYLSYNQLTKAQNRSLFENKSVTEHNIGKSKFWLYLLDQSINATLTSKIVNDKIQSDTPIIEIKDFNLLQKRALQLEHDYQDIIQGAKSYQDLMAHADEINIQLTKQKDELQTKIDKQQILAKSQQNFIKQHYGMFLQNDTQKLYFLQNLLANVNQPQVQNIIKGDPHRLWNLVKAICNYGQTNKTK